MGYSQRMLRQRQDAGLTGREHSGVLDYERAQIGSALLKKALDRYFRRWEKANGFRAGAGAILVPAGYNTLASKQAA